MAESISPDDYQMTFGDHLEELRRRIILALIGVGAAAVLTFTFGFRIVGWLSRPYLEAQFALGFSPQLYAFDFTAGFSTYMKVSLIAAIVLASPWVIYQAWMFVVVGLYEHERRAMHLLWPFSAVMTVLGVLFAYYLLLPVSAVFFLNLTRFYPDVHFERPGFMVRLLVPGQDAGPPDVNADEVAAVPRFPVLATDPDPATEGMVWINRREGRMKAHFGGATRVLSTQSSHMLAAYPGVAQFVSFFAMIVLGVVVAFQLPVAMLVLGKVRVIDPAIVARSRRYALFVCLIAAAILTPADVFSMTLLFLPLYGLFEFGLILMRAAYRRAA